MIRDENSKSKRYVMEMIISSKHNYDVGCIIVQIMNIHTNTHRSHVNEHEHQKSTETDKTAVETIKQTTYFQLSEAICC